jgi:hypothetical protein
MSKLPDPNAIQEKGVTSEELCKRFNARRDWERVLAGELDAIVLDSHPPGPDANQPSGTLSEILSIRTKDGVELSRVHRYLRPDGSIGGSGRPDPKKLFEDGVVYRQKKKKEMTLKS